MEGLEWSGIHYKNADGSQRIDYSVNIKVVEGTSASNIQKITTGLETAYKGTNSDGINISTKVTVETVKSIDKSKDYYVDFVDSLEGDVSETAIGVVDNIGNTQTNRIQISNDLSGSDLTETIQHEVGHTLGLHHDGSRNNIMNAKDLGNTNLKSSQLNTMQTTVPTTIVEPPKPPSSTPPVSNINTTTPAQVTDPNKKTNGI